MSGTASVRFKLDENLPGAAERLLRSHGHDVDTVLAERLGGAADPAVFAACQAERRVLITLDLDFSDIRAYPPASHCGVWVLRAEGARCRTHRAPPLGCREGPCADP